MNNEILILTFLPEKGTTGVQSHFNSFSDYLTESNIANKIITPYTYEPSLYERILRKIVLLIKRMDEEQSIILMTELLNQRLRKNLLKYIKNNSKPYYIYAQEPTIALMASDLKKDFKDVNFIRISLICHFNISEIYEYVISHNVSDTGKLSKYLYRKEEEACKAVDKVIFPSKFLHAIVLKRIGKSVTDAKTTVIHNFVDDDLNSSRAEENKTDFLSIGTLEPRKNQELSLRIIAELHRLGYKKRLIFAGDGHDRVKLEKLASELNITEYIRFLGYVENAKDMLVNTKFLLHSAKIENFPIALLEALSYSIPICAAPVGGIPEVFNDNVEGVYLDLDSPERSAEKISQLFDDETYREASLNARKRYENNFKTENIAPLVLEEIIGVKA